MENAKSAEEEAKASSQEEERAQANRVSGEELMDELGRLGVRFAAVVQAAWRSDERKQLEADLRKGVDSVAKSLEEGFQRIRESEQTKETMEKAMDVADTITERVAASETAHELANGLIQGLRSLGERLDKLVDEIGSKRPQNSAAEQEQDIPVQDISADQKKV